MEHPKPNSCQTKFWYAVLTFKHIFPTEDVDAESGKIIPVYRQGVKRPCPEFSSHYMLKLLIDAFELR